MLLHAQPQLFEFEYQASENLTFIPMCVRFNLDRYGLRLSLAQWQALPYEVRERLCRYPLGAETLDGEPSSPSIPFAADLAAQVEAAGGVLEHMEKQADTSWQRTDSVPPALLKQCELQGLAAPSVSQWQGLGEFQRYVLLKLSRRETANHDFPAAWKEFTL